MKTYPLKPYVLACALASLAPVVCTAGDAAVRSSERLALKKNAPSARLVLPFFELDTERSDGANTYFSVRNESTLPVEIQVAYYAVDTPHNAQLVEKRTLAGKQLVQFTVSDKKADLLVDDDGFARGYAVITTAFGERVIHGDYYQLVPGEGFASGFRLLDADPQNPDNDLCTLFTVRFLNGGPFDDTVINIWLDTGVQPDPETPIGSYAVYNQAGELRFATDLYMTEVASQRLASDMVAVLPVAFGVMEIQLEVEGHVSATLSALGLYSVGVEATCTD